MEDINQVVLIGRLTRDAEQKYTNLGLSVSSFAIAVNGRKKVGDHDYEDEASFFDMAVFGKTSESIQQYLTKGKQVCVVGRLKQDSWEQDGAKRSKVKVEVKTVQLLGSNQQRDEYT